MTRNILWDPRGLVVLTAISLALDSGFAADDPTSKLPSIPVGAGPEGLCLADNALWITNQFDNTATRILLSDKSKVETFKTGTRPIGVAYDGNRVWIANYFDGTVMVLDGASGASVGTIDLGSGSGPGHVLYAGGYIWVAERKANRVARLEIDSLKVTGEYPTGRRPMGLASDGVHIWVANNHDDTVSRLRITDGVNAGTFSVGRSPFGVLSAGGAVWVSNYFGGTVTKLSAEGFAVNEIAVGDGPAGLAATGDRVLVVNNGDATVVALDMSSGAQVAKYEVDEDPFSVVSMADGTLWVSNAGANTLSTSSADLVGDG